MKWAGVVAVNLHWKKKFNYTWFNFVFNIVFTKYFKDTTTAICFNIVSKSSVNINDANENDPASINVQYIWCLQT